MKDTQKPESLIKNKRNKTKLRFIGMNFFKNASASIGKVIVWLFFLVALTVVPLDKLIYQKRPGYKTNTEISYETFKTKINSLDCILMCKVNDESPFPKFEHYKCGTVDYVWAKNESTIGFALYKGEPAWLIGD